jgi:AraC family ethanolamine operon transcriptional activator
MMVVLPYRKKQAGKAMPFVCFTHSQNLQIFRYANIDHFRQGLRGANVDIVPLRKINTPLGQAILSLPGCDVYLLRTFPRIIHAMLEGGGAFIMLAMEDRPAVVFNGKEVESPSLQFARGPLEYRAIEREPGFYAAIVFPSSMEMRGWPETHGGFLAVNISRGSERMLRDLILSHFETVSQCPDLMTPAARAGLEISLLAALDLAFDGWRRGKLSKNERLQDSLRTLKAIDGLIDSKSSVPIYSQDVASKLGISVRALTNLMVKLNGKSLHQYLRLRRLWTVRRELLKGDPRIQIKEVALNNGFWHLSDFASKYSLEFGELPSTTQIRARARQ